MKYIELRELSEEEFQFKESPSQAPSLTITIPESVQNDGWTVLPVKDINVVSCILLGLKQAVKIVLILFFQIHECSSTLKYCTTLINFPTGFSAILPVKLN